MEQNDVCRKTSYWERDLCTPVFRPVLKGISNDSLLMSQHKKQILHTVDTWKIKKLKLKAFLHWNITIQLIHHNCSKCEYIYQKFDSVGADFFSDIKRLTWKPYSMLTIDFCLIVGKLTCNFSFSCVRLILM